MATGPRARAARARLLRSALIDITLPVAAVVLGLTVYHLWVVGTDQPAYRFPTPFAVWDELWPDRRFFAEQAWTTGTEALGGLLIATVVAVALGALMAYNTVLERMLLPLAILVKVTPVVAVAPAFIIWWGFGAGPKVAVAALLTFFPILINAVTGFRAVQPEVLWLLDVYQVPWWRRFLWVRVPAAMPYLLSAIKVSATLAIIGAVVAEWFGADKGLGRVIYLANTDFQPARLFAAVTVLAVMGIGITLVISLVERRLLFWHESRLFIDGGN
ncbi:MAG: ABC transporter permease [Tepidiformaceae bacterium]